MLTGFAEYKTTCDITWATRIQEFVSVFHMFFWSDAQKGIGLSKFEMHGIQFEMLGRPGDFAIRKVHVNSRWRQTNGIELHPYVHVFSSRYYAREWLFYVHITCTIGCLARSGTLEFAPRLWLYLSNCILSPKDKRLSTMYCMLISKMLQYLCNIRMANCSAACQIGLKNVAQLLGCFTVLQHGDILHTKSPNKIHN